MVSDDEEPARGKGKGKGKQLQQEDRSNAWKKPKKAKTRVKHMTYEQILAEANEAPSASPLGVIIDATGATVCSNSRLIFITCRYLTVLFISPVRYHP